MITIRGEKELYARIAKLSNVNAGNTDKAMEFALNPMLNQTITNARALRRPHTPKGGHLDEGVVSQKVKGSSRTRNVWWVSFKGRARYLAHLVEFGTRPHDQPRRHSFHPGAVPKPFFRPAFEGHKIDTLTRLGQAVWEIFKLNLS